jgi:hypothetical protein
MMRDRDDQAYRFTRGVTAQNPAEIQRPRPGCDRADIKAAIAPSAWQRRVAVSELANKIRAYCGGPVNYEPGGRRFESCRARFFHIK